MSFKKTLAQVNAFCSVQYLGLVYWSGLPICKSSSTSVCLSSSQPFTGKRERQRERERKIYALFQNCLFQPLTE